MDLPFSILVVDDSEFMRRVVSSLLKKCGFRQIIEAENAIEAIRLYNKYKPRLIILDLKMPKIDGFHVLKEVKKIDPTAKILILTADAQESTIQMAKNNGAYACLAKPFGLDMLRDAIFNALGENMNVQEVFGGNSKISDSRINGGILLGK